jgi:hypothetical protein
MFTPFDDASAEPAVHGFLHVPAAAGRHVHANGNAIALTHGAGGNCQSKLLVAVSDALADVGFVVLRFDLPFRQARRFGPPHPGNAAQDRKGLRRAASVLRSQIGGTIYRAPAGDSRTAAPGRVFLGGQSYGGRQASLLLAETPETADGLLLLSYPLHPPGRPADLRTQHFPQLTQPVFFVHGTRDPFASSAELQSAMALIPGPHGVLEIDNAGHDLLAKKYPSDIPARITQAFERFLAALPGM